MEPVLFCREVCKIQGVGGPDYLHYLAAYHRAVVVYRDKYGGTLTKEDILWIGEMVGNLSAQIRTTPVIFSNLQTGLKPELIERALDQLLSFQESISPEIFYREFEKIHPFEDGNGRVGALLYNILNKTIYDPEIPEEPEW